MSKELQQASRAFELRYKEKVKPKLKSQSLGEVRKQPEAKYRLLKTRETTRHRNSVDQKSRWPLARVHKIVFNLFVVNLAKEPDHHKSFLN